jgi:hypothetical protein
MVAAITLAKPLPALVRLQQTVVVSGRVRPSVNAAVAALEYRPPPGAGRQTWTFLATASIGKNGAFSLRWKVKQLKSVPISLRVVAVRDVRTLAATAPVQSAIGPAAVPCAAPVPPAVNIPVGAGWIEGGLIIQGGAFPGVYECESQPYTITATNTTTGAVAARMNVAGGHSYTLVVPAGTYTLSATAGCPGRGTATVTAAMGTTANTYCDVP